jgi:hypothetical protein
MTADPALAGRDQPSGDEALAHARAIAADWRAAGLQVGLVEHTLPDGRPGGCVLVARSPTRVLHCACRPATSRDGRPLWAVEVSLGRCGDDRDGIEHVHLRTVGTAVAGACGPAWRQVLGWIHGGDTLEAGPEAAPVASEWWRGWAAGAARCRSRLRTVIGRHLVAPGLAGAADRLRRAAPSPRWTGVASSLARVGRRSAPALAGLAARVGRVVPRPDWRRAAEPLLKGGLVCLAGVVIAVGGVCLAGWRFAAQDERAYHAYARMCAAAVHDGAAAEDEFWCKRTRQLRLLYRFADAGETAAR